MHIAPFHVCPAGHWHDIVPLSQLRPPVQMHEGPDWIVPGGGLACTPGMLSQTSGPPPVVQLLVSSDEDHEHVDVLYVKLRVKLPSHDGVSSEHARIS